MHSAHRIKELPRLRQAEYLAVMCHEIGTPLNVIIGLSDILATVECSQQKKKEYAGMMRDSSDILMELIKNMLDFSKAGAGMIEIENIAFDPAKLVHKAARIMATKVAEKGLDLHVYIANDLPTQCIGDPLRIHQILLNLLSNAVKFTQSGHITLYVNTKADWDGNEQLSITVADTGIGNGEDSLEKIFSKYAQVDSSVGRKYGGTGLGLAISQELAQLMRGDIAVKSWPGMGSQFVVTLPLRKAC